MKKLIDLIVSAFNFSLAFPQGVSINQNNAFPEPSAMHDMQLAEKGQAGVEILAETIT